MCGHREHGSAAVCTRPPLLHPCALDNPLRAMSDDTQRHLSLLWTQGPVGHLTPWSQAKAWALAVVWSEQHGTCTYGRNERIAQRPSGSRLSPQRKLWLRAMASSRGSEHQPVGGSVRTGAMMFQGGPCKAAENNIHITSTTSISRWFHDRCGHLWCAHIWARKGAHIRAHSRTFAHFRDSAMHADCAIDCGSATERTHIRRNRLSLL